MSLLKKLNDAEKVENKSVVEEESSFLVTDHQLSEIEQQEITLEQTELISEEFIHFQNQVLDWMREDDTNTQGFTRDGMKLYLIELIDRKNKSDVIPEDNVFPIITALINDMYDYGPAQIFMVDDDVTDVRIVGDHYIEYKRNGRYEKSFEHRFRSEEHLANWVNRKATLIGSHFDRSEGSVNALLPDGSRLHAITTVSGIGTWNHGKYAIQPATIVTIRKFVRFYTPEELVVNRFMDQRIKEYLKLITMLRFTIIFAGGMGTGKTTTMNTLFSFIQESHVSGILEEAPEMQPQHENVIRLWERQGNSEGKGRFDIRKLLKESLRMDLNRIFISEIRDAAIAYYFLQAINTGHPGSMSTTHANSARAALLRLISLASSAPEAVRSDILYMIQEGVQTIVYIEKSDDNEKYIAEIAEIGEVKGDTITLNPVFTIHFDEDGIWNWVFHGVSEKIKQAARRSRLKIPEVLIK